MPHVLLAAIVLRLLGWFSTLDNCVRRALTQRTPVGGFGGGCRVVWRVLRFGFLCCLIALTRRDRLDRISVRVVRGRPRSQGMLPGCGIDLWWVFPGGRPGRNKPVTGGSWTITLRRCRRLAASLGKCLCSRGMTR